MARNFFDLKQVKTTSGGVIKAFRKNFQITQHELAEVTGIAETNLSAIENDKVELGLKRAVLISAVFGIDPSLLLFPNGFEDYYNKDVRAVRLASEKSHRYECRPQTRATAERRSQQSSVVDAKFLFNFFG